MKLTPKQKDIMATVERDGSYTASEYSTGNGTVQGVRAVKSGLILVDKGLLTYERKRSWAMRGYLDTYTFTKKP